MAKKFFRVSYNTGNEVFKSYEVENEAKFSLGDDSLRYIISSNFRIYKKRNFNKVPLIIGIVVDKKGKATLNGIIKSSNDSELDNEAIRVAEIICKYDFIPASHRGEKVSTIYPVIFLKNDIVH